MKTLIVIVAVLLVLVVARRLFGGPSLPPEEAEKRVATGAAVLIDVREPAEWASGVAKPAVLLPLSDLTGGRLSLIHISEPTRPY